MRDAMIAGTTLNTFNNHCDRVVMANLAQIINVLQAVILTDEEKMLLTPTYHVMKMYNVHQDALMLPVNLMGEDYTLGEEKLPALSVSASKNNDGVVHISLTNIDAHNTKKVSIDLRGISFSSIEGQILNSAKVQDHNTFDSPDKVKPASFRQFKRSENVLEVELPPVSVVVLSVK